MADIIRVRNPRTGRYDYEISPPTAPDLKALAAALRRAQRRWWRAGLDARIDAMQAWKHAFLREKESIIEALTTDTGRHLLTLSEVNGTPLSIDRWCGLARDLLRGETGVSAVFPHLSYKTEDVPYPLVAVISPWNFPLLLSLIDTLPALLAGAAVIVKPSEVTPRFIAPLLRTIEAVPLLHGVFRFIPGAGATGAALIDEVDAVCFTGSVKTGRTVAEHAARRFIPAFLELGGKDPLIVLKSADLEAAATAALRGSVANAGQACQAIERIYVDATIFEPFVDLLTKKAQAVEFNFPDIHKGSLGPLIFDKQADIIERHLEDARAKGAVFRTGGHVRTLGGGRWCEPTVLTNVTHEMAVVSEETFGPIMPVMKFSTVADAIALANDTVYGLSAGVIAGSAEEAIAVGREIDAGAISINDASLTSIFREAEKNSFRLSGMGGSRMGSSAFKRFLRRKLFIVNTQKPMPLEALDEAKAAGMTVVGKPPTPDR